MKKCLEMISNQSTAFDATTRQKQTSGYCPPQVVLLETQPETGTNITINETTNGIAS